MVSKSGQMKIQQTAFLIIALTLFFVLVGLFALTMMFSGVQKEKSNIEEKEAMLLVSRLSNSAEFTCGEAFSGVGGDCVDFDKMMVLSSNIDNFSRLWGVSGIEIIKTYPLPEGICDKLSSPSCKCTKENYPDCGFLEVYPNEGRGKSVSTFISLCRKQNGEGMVLDKCEVAKLVVRFSEVEVKNEI